MSTKNSLMAVATMMSTAGFSASAYAGDKDEECARLIARGEIPLATIRGADDQEDARPHNGGFMRTQRNGTKHEQSRRGVVRRSGLRALTVGALIATLLLAVAGTAHATTNVRKSGNQLNINSGNVSDNMSVNVDLDGSFIIRNFNDTLITGGACQKIDNNTVNCPSAGITNIQANLQGGSDTLRNNTGLPLRAFLGSGNDTFSGGSGRDFVNGDEGSDTLRGNGGNDILVGDAGNDNLRGNGGNDTLDGGSGTDRCVGESKTNCEQ